VFLQVAIFGFSLHRVYSFGVDRDFDGFAFTDISFWVWSWRRGGGKGTRI